MTAKRVGYCGSSQCQLVLGQFHVGEMDEKLHIYSISAKLPWPFSMSVKLPFPLMWVKQ